MEIPVWISFLPDHSTTHQLIELINEICMALDNREFICLVFCDGSKAFDRVWLRGLLLKLERYGIKGNLLQRLRSYISAREQQVIIKKMRFLGKVILWQGFPRGPSLFPFSS